MLSSKISVKELPLKVFCRLAFTDSADGRGDSGNFPAALVTVLPGNVHHASAGGELSAGEELLVYDAVDAPHRLHQQRRQSVRLRAARRQVSNSVHGQRTKLLL